MHRLSVREAWDNDLQRAVTGVSQKEISVLSTPNINTANGGPDGR